MPIRQPVADTIMKTQKSNVNMKIIMITTGTQQKAENHTNYKLPSQSKKYNYTFFKYISDKSDLNKNTKAWNISLVECSSFDRSRHN